MKTLYFINLVEMVKIEELEDVKILAMTLMGAYGCSIHIVFLCKTIDC